MSDEVFQVEEIETISFDENGKEDGTWKGFTVTKIDDPADYCFDCRDKFNAKALCEYLNKNSYSTSINDDLNEWTGLITELSANEEKLIALKEEYATKEFEIVFVSDIDFKGLYGSTAEKVRKQHASNELKPLKDKINDLELSIDYLKRRITFLKDLIRTKRTLMEIKE